MAVLDEIKAHREEILALAKKYGLKDVRVFGSVARGEERPDSDIDFLVELDKPNYTDAFGFIKFIHDSEGLFGRKVDLVFESGLYHLLKDSVLNEAQNI